MATTVRKGYSALQIGLHWTVALLIVAQFLGHDGIAAAWDAFKDGAAVAPAQLAYLHVIVGLSILMLALWRLWLRFSRGVPPAPETGHPALRLLAKATHVAIYALIIGMPLGGAAAWFLGIEPAAAAHSLAAAALFWLVILHVAGALVEQFVLKSGVLARMAVSED